MQIGGRQRGGGRSRRDAKVAVGRDRGGRQVIRSHETPACGGAGGDVYGELAADVIGDDARLEGRAVRDAGGRRGGEIAARGARGKAGRGRVDGETAVGIDRTVDDGPSGDVCARDRATGSVEDDIASAGRDGGADQDIGSDRGGRSVRSIERLQDQVDRAARRSDAGRGGDDTRGVGADIDRAGAGTRDAGEGDLGGARTGPGIEGEAAGNTSRRSEGERDRLGDRAVGEDAHGRTRVDGGLDVRRVDDGSRGARGEVRQGAARGRTSADGDVIRVDQPEAADAGLDEAR